VIDFTEKGEFIDTISNGSGIDLRKVKLVAEDGGMIELLHYTSHPQPDRGDKKLWENGPTHVASGITVSLVHINPKPLIELYNAAAKGDEDLANTY